MAITLERFGITELSQNERIELIGLIWDSLHSEAIIPNEWHLQEVERRIIAADADPDAGVPWHEFKAKWLAES